MEGWGPLSMTSTCLGSSLTFRTMMSFVFGGFILASRVITRSNMKEGGVELELRVEDTLQRYLLEFCVILLKSR